MINFQPLIAALNDTQLKPLADCLPEAIAEGLSIQRYGDLPAWLDALAALPDITPSVSELKSAFAVGTASDMNAEHSEQLEQALRGLIPWRKGPYTLFDLHIDTEWRSDWKWDRLLPHISPLQDRTILDVGCGNGYHCWRMFGEGAKRVIGIDPSPRFVVQFYMLKKYVDAALGYTHNENATTAEHSGVPVDVLPLGIESLPENLNAFDTTFSMGVLYHRRSPMDHLRELKATLKPGGELVLETLIIEGELGKVLVPEGRYAMMNNVWFIPSAPTLVSWLKKCGFTDVRCVDTNTTELNEQRATDWMHYQSLENFLDPNDPSRTAEDHPAPLRGIFIARKPA